MKSILYSIFFILLLSACTTSSENKKEESVKKQRAENECPKGHTDEIVPILYGFPSEESFLKADSGLVVLGGCELPENPKNYYCKKHKIEF